MKNRDVKRAAARLTTAPAIISWAVNFQVSRIQKRKQRQKVEITAGNFVLGKSNLSFPIAYSIYSTLRLSTKNSRPAVILRAMPPHLGQRASRRSTPPS